MLSQLYKAPKVQSILSLVLGRHHSLGTDITVETLVPVPPFSAGAGEPQDSIPREWSTPLVYSLPDVSVMAASQAHLLQENLQPWEHFPRKLLAGR